jgi:nitroreductase
VIKMIDNEVLKAIRERRSVVTFEPKTVTEEQLEAILEAGRWAPSQHNSQPWEFVVVKDPELRKKLSEVVRRISAHSLGVMMAPVVIAVAVDPTQNPWHFVEAGAVATQNMALAAHSLGLASFWAGIYDADGGRKSAEAEVRRLLDLPKDHRVIALLPIGVPNRYGASQAHALKGRKEMRELIYYDRYSRDQT